jgi:pyruvate formate lyase activating enzyme
MGKMAEQELTGKTYDIQGFSVQDGPGIRTTVFLKGCPLRCPWCHSPESQEFSTELNWLEIKCLGLELCGHCLNVCPNGAITPGQFKETGLGDRIQLPAIERSRCDNCGECADVCKAKALYLCGIDYSVDEIMERLAGDIPFFENSGGGVTISGGECLCQPRFTLELLKRCRERGIHTAVDTSGCVDFRHIEEILPYTDLFLYDLKCMDSALHKRVIGVPNELILENARKIAVAGGKFQIRIPVIPVFNESVESFQKYGSFCLELGTSVELIQLLPYHPMGVAKYARLQRDTPMAVAEPPSERLMEDRRKMLENLGFRVAIH